MLLLEEDKMPRYAEVDSNGLVVQMLDFSSPQVLEYLKTTKPTSLFVLTEYFGDAYLYKYVDGVIVYDPNGKPSPDYPQ
jgi:hypothetical protein